MGRLAGPKDLTFRLNGHVVAGRSPYCSLQLHSERASKQHAEIWWQDGRWRVRDLSNRNGTFVDGVRLKPGQVGILSVGSRLQFGQQEDPWELIDADAPTLIARTDDGDTRGAVNDLLALPTDDDPVATLYADEEGWWAETGPDRRELSSGDAIEVAGQTWTIELPLVLANTIEDDVRPTPAEVEIAFAVTSDEEVVDLEMQHGEKTLTLEPRAHHYMLLTLAREILRDADLGHAPEARGWMLTTDLARMLGVDERTLNVHVYRARTQFAQAGLADAANVIERHGRTGRLRLSVGGVAVRVHQRER